MQVICICECVYVRLGFIRVGLFPVELYPSVFQVGSDRFPDMSPVRSTTVVHRYAVVGVSMDLESVMQYHS